MKLSLAYLGLLSSVLRGPGGRGRISGGVGVGVSAEAPATPILISAAVPRAVDYVDPYDGAALRGHVVLPASSPPRGFVAILPDWDGVNDYEIRRASMLSEQMGYVAFAADVYGVDVPEDYNPTEIEDKMRLSGLYRNNVTLSGSRIKAAIDAVKGMPEYVEGAGVAIVGYCFGGTIALNHALSGAEDARATIAFHGSVDFVHKDFNVTVKNPVAIFSGGKDTMDSTASIVEIEEALNAGDNVWEIGRYSDVGHGFTVFDGPAYNEYVDGRSWESARRFLDEAFGNIELEAHVPPTVTGEDVSYTDPVDGTELTGFVSLPEGDEKVPAVVIIHDANGIDDYEKKRAHMLSDMGYVGFAADIYGPRPDVDFADWNQVRPLLSSIRGNPPFFVQRMKAAVEYVKSRPRVDPTRIAMIGYCFGGTGVLYYAVDGQSDVRAVVSYHGGLIPELYGPRNDTPTIHARINVQSGGDDDASSDVEMLEGAMVRGNATWEYARYSDVLHSFTVWDTTTRPGMNAYDLRADVRSWESTKTFLAEAFEDEDWDDAVIDTTTSTATTTTAAAAATTGGATTGSASTATTTTAAGSASTAATTTTTTTTSADSEEPATLDDGGSSAPAKSFTAAAAVASAAVALMWLIV